MTVAIVDTGPLVAFFDRAERHHRWVVERFAELDAPLLVCEPVLAEAMYLLARYPKAADAVLQLIQNGALSVSFRLDQHLGALRKLLQKYRDTPMSLADACIVRMSEIHDRHAVLTLDSDFPVYRKHGRASLTLIHPAAQYARRCRTARLMLIAFVGLLSLLLAPSAARLMRLLPYFRRRASLRLWRRPGRTPRAI
jgi:predicted nucleic acid-binding protein